MPLESCIEVGILINTNLVEVWQALADPQKLDQWANGPEVELRWALHGSAGQHSDPAVTYPGNFSKVLRVDPLKRLEYSCWIGSGDESNPSRELSAVTVTVTSKGMGTYLHVKQVRQTEGRSLEIACGSWSSKLIALKKALEGRDERRGTGPSIN
jgi:uncharacterized protein YndB with AHSA1/START domain